MDFIKNLNARFNFEFSDNQKDIILKIEEPFLFLSIPGGGKSLLLFLRYVNMVKNENIDPKNILFLNNNTMDSSFLEKLEKSFDIKFKIVNMKSLCEDVLYYFVKKYKKLKPKIIKDNDNELLKLKLLKQVIFKVSKKTIKDDEIIEISNKISYVKSSMFSMKRIIEINDDIENFSEIFRLYEKEKTKLHLIDYEDLYLSTYKLLKADNSLLKIFKDLYKYILVDEAHDLTIVQHKIIKLISYPNTSLCLAGNNRKFTYTKKIVYKEDQTNFDYYYPDLKIVKSLINYRSKVNIKVPVENLLNKYLNEDISEGEDIHLERANRIKFKDVSERYNQYSYLASKLQKYIKKSNICILSRSNNSIISMINIFEKNKIPFRLNNLKINFFENEIVVDLLNFLNFSINQKNIKLFEKIYTKMNIVITEKNISFIKNNIKKNQNVFDTILESDKIEEFNMEIVKYVKSLFKKMALMKPSKAITFIVNKLGYSEVLKKFRDEKGYTIFETNEFIDTLITISNVYNTNFKFMKRISFLDNLIKNHNNHNNNDCVYISNLSTANNMEFKKVYIVDMVEGLFPLYKNSKLHFDKEFIQNELKKFIYGTLRSKKELELLTFEKMFNLKVEKSRFLKDLKKIQLNLLAKNSYNLIKFHTKIFHTKFSLGEILSFDKEKGLSEVYFYKYGKKKLALDTCIKNGFIKILDNVNTKLTDKEMNNFITKCLYDSSPKIRQYALKTILNSKYNKYINFNEHIKKVLNSEIKSYNIKLCENILNRS
jgi:DNA helicase-2/ATP-dependent DNA helicase PcrA